MQLQVVSPHYSERKPELKLHTVALINDLLALTDTVSLSPLVFSNSTLIQFCTSTDVHLTVH